jgi:hypothetical protein
MQQAKTSFRDFLYDRVDKILLSAGKTEEYLERDRENDLRYNNLIKILNEEQIDKFNEYLDSNQTEGLLHRHCYHAGLLDGIALGAKALLEGDVFDV